jgi:anti-anti-sigma factor
MAIQDYSGGVLLVDLPGHPSLGEELDSATRIMRDRGTGSVVLDFAAVDFLDSSHVGSLLRLRQLVRQHGGRLVCCGLGSAAGRVLSTTGLANLFEILPDRPGALAALLPPADGYPTGA